jgi:hypothetical protein
MFCDWIAGVGELVVLALEVEERHAGERRSASFVECHHVSVETRSVGVHFSCLQLMERVHDANHPLKQACSSTNPATTLVRSRPLPGAAPVVAFRVKELRPRHSTTLASTAHGASTSPPPCGRELLNRVGDMDSLRGLTFPCQPSRRDRSSSNVGGPLEGSDNGGRGLGHHQLEYSHTPSANNPGSSAIRSARSEAPSRGTPDHLSAHPVTHATTVMTSSSLEEGCLVFSTSSSLFFHSLSTALLGTGCKQNM